MACCALIGALVGAAVRRLRRSPQPTASSVATARWSAMGERGRELHTDGGAPSSRRG